MRSSFNTKINTLAFGISTAIIFSLMQIVNITIDHIEGILGELLRIGITFIASAGFFKIIISIIRLAVSKFWLLRKWLLGKQYVEGTWVGYYIEDGIPLLWVEWFTQEN